MERIAMSQQERDEVEWLKHAKAGSITQREALALLKQPDWHDFGPTFAAEQLAKQHQIQVGKETLRGWMIEAGMWKPKSRRIEQVHLWRKTAW